MRTKLTYKQLRQLIQEEMSNAKESIAKIKVIKSHYNKELSHNLYALILNIGSERSSTTELIKLLLQQPTVNVNYKSYNSQPLLITAIERAGDEIIELLLQRPDIDVNIQNSSGQTPLMWACYIEDVNSIKLLLKHPRINVNIRDMYGKTALDYAEENNNKKIINLLKQHGAK